MGGNIINDLYHFEKASYSTNTGICPIAHRLDVFIMQKYNGFFINRATKIIA